jgi:hypothetical protein
MSLELQSYDQGVAAGAMAKVSNPEFPDDLAAGRIAFEVQVEIKNNTAGALDYTFARAKKAAACLFGFISNWWGQRAKEIFDNAITLDQLREFIIATTDDDILINGKFYGAYADADVIQAAVAAGGTLILTIEVPRPFELTKLGKDSGIWAAGSTQMRLFHSEIKRLTDGDFDTNGNFVQNKASSWTLLADTKVAHDDCWANVPRLYVNQEIGKINHAPSGEMGILGIWERSKTGVQTMAGAAGTLGFVSVRRAGDAPLHENIKAARLARHAKFAALPGQQDLGALACPLLILDQAIDPNDIPCGAGVIVEMPGAEIVGGANIAYAFIPAFDNGYAETYVVTNLVGKEKGMPKRVKLVQALSKQGRSVTSALAAIAPRAILRESDSDFATSPGDYADAESSSLLPHIPSNVLGAAQAAAKAAGDGDAKEAIATQAAKQIAKFQTGAVSVRRRRWTPARKDLAGAIAGRNITQFTR